MNNNIEAVMGERIPARVHADVNYDKSRDHWRFMQPNGQWTEAIYESSTDAWKASNALWENAVAGERTPLDQLQVWAWPIAVEHAKADHNCGRKWECACGGCRIIRKAPFGYIIDEALARAEERAQ